MPANRTISPENAHSHCENRMENCLSKMNETKGKRHEFFVREYHYAMGARDALIGEIQY